MFNDRYAKTLQAWVLGEAEKVGSLRQLANRFVTIAIGLGEDAVSVQTLSDWSKGKLKQEIKQRPLRQLAAYRNETVEQTRQWLEGVNRQPDGFMVGESEGVYSVDQREAFWTVLEGVNHYLQSAPFRELPRAIAELSQLTAIASSRLHQLYGPLSMCHPLRYLLLSELGKLGIDLTIDQDMERFAEAGDGAFDECDRWEKLRLLVDEGRNTFDEADLILLSAMLRKLNGTEYPTLADIVNYIKNPPSEELEGCDFVGSVG